MSCDFPKCYFDDLYNRSDPHDPDYSIYINNGTGISNNYDLEFDFNKLPRGKFNVCHMCTQCLEEYNICILCDNYMLNKWIIIDDENYMVCSECMCRHFFSRLNMDGSIAYPGCSDAPKHLQTQHNEVNVNNEWFIKDYDEISEDEKDRINVVFQYSKKVYEEKQEEIKAKKRWEESHNYDSALKALSDAKNLCDKLVCDDTNENGFQKCIDLVNEIMDCMNRKNEKSVKVANGNA